MSIGAPEVINRNEKRMLQESVDTLLNNSLAPAGSVYREIAVNSLAFRHVKGKAGSFPPEPAR